MSLHRTYLLRRTTILMLLTLLLWQVGKTAAQDTGSSNKPTTAQEPVNLALPQPAPFNDNINNASYITTTPYNTSVNTTDATSDVNDPLPCGIPTTYTVWYRYVPPVTGTLTIDLTGSNYDTLVGVYRGTPGNLTEIACNDDAFGTLQSYVEVATSANDSIYILVGGYYDRRGLAQVNIDYSFVIPPANDDFNNAQVIPSLPTDFTADISDATTDPDDPMPTLCGPYFSGFTNSIWYRYTPTQTGGMRLNLTTNGNVMVSVWSGTRTNLTEIGCQYYSGQLQVPTTANIPLYIMVNGVFNVSGGLTDIAMQSLTPPANDRIANAIPITGLPWNETVDMSQYTLNADEHDIAPTCLSNGRLAWYQYTPTQTVDAFIGLSVGNFSGMVTIFANTITPESLVSCISGGGAREVTFSAGTTYYIGLTAYVWPDFSTVPIMTISVEENIPFTSCANATGVPQDDCQALVDLYNNTDGNNWSRHAYWLTANNVCFWSDVYCANGRVSHLYLGNNNLVGNLPASIGNLTEAKVLQFDGNRLIGTLPDSVGNLLALEYLGVSRNNMVGPLPETLVNLRYNANYPNNLILWLDHNGFTASPQVTDFLTASLIADYWQAKQTVPPDGFSVADIFSSAAKFTWTPITYQEGTGYYQVQWATSPAGFFNSGNTVYNKMSSSITIHGLSANTTYYARIRTVTKSGTPNQSTVTSVWSDVLRFDTFSSGFCDSVTQIPRTQCEVLVDFYNTMGGNNWTFNTFWLSGNTPCTWYGVTCSNRGYVTGLRLPNNNVQGNFNDTLLADNVYGVLNSFTYLQLNDNPITGTIPQTLANMPKPNAINFVNTSMTGSIPCESAQVRVSDCEALKAFYTSTQGANWSFNDYWLMTNEVCRWHGVTCSPYGYVTGITLPTNNLSGPLPPEMGDLYALATLILINNNLTGSIPSTLLNLPHLVTLNLANNQLSGALPSGWLGVPQLRYLDVSLNDLNGPLPSDLSALHNLRWLVLMYNNFDGPLPPELSQLTYLQYLFANNNAFTGEIPDEWGDFSWLYWLNLGNNQLSGQIPASLGNVQSLYILQLHGNQFTGTLPAEIAQLPSLHALMIQQNAFDSLPVELTDNTMLNTGDIFSDINDVDFGYNKITITDPSLLDALQALDDDWYASQTLPPDTVLISPRTIGLAMAWLDKDDLLTDGYYEVYISLAPDGTYDMLVETTADLSDRDTLVGDLPANTTVYVCVQRVTPASGDQQNTLTSRCHEKVAYLVVGDTDQDSIVAPNDAMIVINRFSQSIDAVTFIGDVNGDAIVDETDVNLVLSQLGLQAID